MSNLLRILAILAISPLLSFPSGAEEPPPSFVGAQPAAREILLKFKGSVSFNTRLEASSNLFEWSPLATFPKSAATLEHTDSSAAYMSSRYYRIIRLTSTNAIAGDHLSTADGDVVVRPINHATMVIGWKDKVIYVDPTGGAARFTGLPKPTMVLVTDIHGDHLDSPTLNAIGAADADIIAPQAVLSMLSTALRGKTQVLANGAKTEKQGVGIEAVPMYNITPARLSYHSKGRGNGYVLTIGGTRLYVSGDTEDIPEMRALQNVDAAFLCMNLPFTMNVDQAASASREFRPKIVFPYHWSGTSNSDLAKFKTLVGTDLGIEVRMRKWY